PAGPAPAVRQRAGAPAGRVGGGVPGADRGHRAGGAGIDPLPRGGRPMIRLTWVELRRFFARTLVIAGMLAGVAVAGLTLVTGAASVHPLNESEIAAAEQYYQEAVADWEQHGAEMEASCREQEALEREATGQDVDFGCDQMAPQREWYVPQPPAFGDYLPAILLMLSTLMVLLPLMVGATATAAEHSTGAIGNWLTFEPRRLRVYA